MEQTEITARWHICPVGPVALATWHRQVRHLATWRNLSYEPRGSDETSFAIKRDFSLFGAHTLMINKLGLKLTWPNLAIGLTWPNRVPNLTWQPGTQPNLAQPGAMANLA